MAGGHPEACVACVGVVGGSLKKTPTSLKQACAELAQSQQDASQQSRRPIKINLSTEPRSFGSCHLGGEPVLFPSHVYGIPRVSWLKIALETGVQPTCRKR